ncbi:MAG: hypothetical protein PHS93_10245 [Candidatus Omnitrophica bacterium]|nr:hypothetical protein [Candidatus Omnitrophota bacterium]MDD5353530.1 hypothetical protein [Candidatus Omnitrophota bacterium]
MYADETFTVVSTEIKADVNEEFHIIPLGDVHLGSEACDESRFDYMCQWITRKKNVYVYGLGDYTDMMRAHDRYAVETQTAESTQRIMDRIYREEAEKFIKKVMPFKDRILGLGEGNHRGHLTSGITTTQYMCDRLNTKYLGYMCYFGLTVSPRSKRNTALQLVLLTHHGIGGNGRLAGASINRVEKLERIAVADIYMMGHDHQKGVRPLSKFVPCNKGGFNIRTRKQLLITTGGFLKSYMANMPSYAVRVAYPPADLGCAKISVVVRRDRDGGNDMSYFDLHASV